MSTEPYPPTTVHDSTALTTALAYSSGVSWGAVLAGAVAAAALSLILLLLGVGFGLSSVSPWSGEGVSATTLSWSSIIWITFMSLAASGVGGYIAGRLRAKWVGVLSDEIYFRDTAHGLLAWAVATLLMATLLVSAATGVIGSSVEMAADSATKVAAAAVPGSADAIVEHSDENALNYFVSSLFRSDPRSSMQTANRASDEKVEKEVSVIFVTALAEDQKLSQQDLDYVAGLVAQRTQLNQQQAARRVAEVDDRTQEKLKELDTSIREAADNAKHASAYASLWFSVALLIGAFVASLAAISGGRRRDF